MNANKMGWCITLPQLKTKPSSKPRKSPTANAAVLQHPTLTDACDLIGMMLDYETTARSTGANLTAGRYSMLTASERQALRAELVGDYIRLSANRSGITPGQFDSAMESFCSKVCDMSLPSHELIGTYLAAVDIVTKGDQLSNISGLADAVRTTMATVLHGCVAMLRTKLSVAG